MLVAVSIPQEPPTKSLRKYAIGQGGQIKLIPSLHCYICIAASKDTQYILATHSLTTCYRDDIVHDVLDNSETCCRLFIHEKHEKHEKHDMEIINSYEQVSSWRITQGTQFTLAIKFLGQNKRENIIIKL